jgi:hypothetical protein
VLSNPFDSITSAPVMLNVVSPVERRLVPGLSLTLDLEMLVNVEYSDELGGSAQSSPLATIILEESPQ